MANRAFNRYQSLEKEVKSLYLDVAIGASGAPTLSRGLGVASITRSSTGLYVITLQDAYNRLLNARVTILNASAQDAHPQLVSESVASAKTISFRTITGSTGAVVDPANGARLLISLELKNSSI